LSFEQLAPLLLHLPTLGHSALVKQTVAASEHSPDGQSWSEAHALTALLQVPFVVQVKSVVQGLPFFAPAAVHLPSVCGH